MRKKEFVIIGGANGSGKTTFADAYSKKYPFDYINADKIVEDLGGDGVNQPEPLKIKAGRRFFQQFDTLLEADKNIMVESTLSGQYLLRLIRKVKELNYSVQTIYIFLENPAICIERIKGRVLKGGHFVPDDMVIRRYNRSKENFWKKYKSVSDRWFLIYNSKQEFTEIALGAKDDYVINHKALFQIFYEDVAGGIN